MRSDRDEMVRYREECKRLQIEVAELKKSRTVINGIPEKQHQEALGQIAKLESSIKSQNAAHNRQIKDAIDKVSAMEEKNRQLQSRLAQASTSPIEKRQVIEVDKNAGLVQELQTKVVRLHAKLAAASEIQIRTNKKHVEEVSKLTAEINRLQCKLRRTNDD